MKILITGTAGFIGFYLCRRLSEEGNEVVGIDNINDYYDVRLKYGRLAELGIAENDVAWDRHAASSKYPALHFIRMNVEDREALPRLFEHEHFDRIVHLAAQAGVRYSIENPWAYIESNILGFMNVLECCRHHRVEHLVYASSSSVYGGNTKVPFSEEDRVDSPVSLYAATKKADELMASCYAKLYGIAATGLRFFTVYGPWGRPDMAPMLFAKAILSGEPIKVFNHGAMNRDFTYIDDIVEGVVRVLDRVPEADTDGRRHAIYNIGHAAPVPLMDFIAAMEQALGHKAEKIFLPMQPGDVCTTYADTSHLQRDFGYCPSTTLAEGIRQFVEWYENRLLFH